MSIKKIITTGCSFTQVSDAKDTWPSILENRLADYNIVFEHLGLESTGNELTQRKATLAVYESLKEYAPDEILVMAMWSTHDRKTFYLQDHQIKDLISKWKSGKKIYISSQFADLKNKFTDKIEIKTDDDCTIYASSKGSGWFNIHNSFNDYIGEFYYRNIHNLQAGVNYTLEHMLFLNMVCEKKGVRILNSTIHQNIHDEIDNYRNDQLNKHLAEEYDKINFMKPMYNVLKKLNDDSYLREDKLHPSMTGSIYYTDTVILPELKKQNLFGVSK